MLKDNESVPLTISLDGPTEPSGPIGFAAQDLITCEECLRANPPTRASCLYCGRALPATETSASQQKPAIQTLDKWQKGYNTILLTPPANLTPGELAEAADVLSLAVETLQELLSSDQPIPLARTATFEDATIIERRLTRLQIQTRTVTDEQLGIEERSSVKIRSARFTDDAIRAYQSPEAAGIEIPWTKLDFIVLGRLIFQRIEMKELKGGRTDGTILDSSQFFSDEAVVDIYAGEITPSYRIAANSFDFSCLGRIKRLLVTDNIARLIDQFRERAPQADFDESYNALRRRLSAAWPADQHTSSHGLSRSGRKVSVGSANETSNEAQFLRYSRLRYFFLKSVE